MRPQVRQVVPAVNKTQRWDGPQLVAVLNNYCLLDRADVWLRAATCSRLLAACCLVDAANPYCCCRFCCCCCCWMLVLPVPPRGPSALATKHFDCSCVAPSLNLLQQHPCSLAMEPPVKRLGCNPWAERTGPPAGSNSIHHRPPPPQPHNHQQQSKKATSGYGSWLPCPPLSPCPHVSSPCSLAARC